MDVHEVLAVVVSSRRSTDTARETNRSSASESYTSPFSAKASQELDLTAPVPIPRGSLDIAKPAGYSLSRMLSGTIFPGVSSLSRTSTSSTATGRSSPYSPTATFGHGNLFNEERGWWPGDKELGAQDVPEASIPKRRQSTAGGIARCLAEQGSLPRGLADFDAMYHMDLDRHNA